MSNDAARQTSSFALKLFWKLQRTTRPVFLPGEVVDLIVYLEDAFAHVCRADRKAMAIKPRQSIPVKASIGTRAAHGTIHTERYSPTMPYALR